MTKENISFDFNDIALETEADLHLVHPKTEMPLYAPVAKGEDPESKPVLLKLFGSAAPQYQRAVDAMMKKAAKRGNRKATVEEAREQNVEFLTALSISVSNMTFDGEVVDNPDAFRKLYSNPKWEWCTKQINSFLNEDGNFLK